MNREVSGDFDHISASLKQTLFSSSTAGLTSVMLADMLAAFDYRKLESTCVLTRKAAMVWMYSIFRKTLTIIRRESKAGGEYLGSKKHQILMPFQLRDNVLFLSLNQISDEQYKKTVTDLFRQRATSSTERQIFSYFVTTGNGNNLL